MKSLQTDANSVEELSQAKARFGVCVVALLYMAGWTIFSGPVSRTSVLAVAAYAVISAAWGWMVKRYPGDVPWRRITMIFGDLGINTFFLHALQEKGAVFYPMYLWIIVGNGMRFGPRYLVLAMIVGVGYFGPMLFLSDYWRSNAVAGSGLLVGLIVLPLFYLALIRNLHRANAALQEQVKRSQAADRAKTEFLANMSHELRTPMSGVIGVAQLLRDTDLDVNQAEYLDLIQRSAGSLLHIIDDVLEISSIEAGKVSLQSVPVDLDDLVVDVYDLLRPVAEKKKLDLRLSAPFEPIGTVRADPTRIRQILVNLVGNAVKFTEHGSITIDFSYEDSEALERSTEGTFEVRVVDTGIGIPRAKLTSIFDKFEQVETNPDRRFGGTGLGLAISRDLARMMGGDITVESEPNQGSRFTLTLPLERSEDSGVQAGLRDQDAAATSGLLALVVEDNPVNRLVTCGFLERLGIASRAVEDGESALERLDKEVFDIVFMDVELPEMNGLETTRRIRAKEGAHHVPIVALTANAFDKDREDCLRAGMDLHLHKPIQPSDLEAALATLRQRGLLSAEFEPGAASKR